MLVAVAAGSPCATSRPRTKNWSKATIPVSSSPLVVQGAHGSLEGLSSPLKFVLKGWWLKTTTSARKPPVANGPTAHPPRCPSSQLQGNGVVTHTSQHWQVWQWPCTRRAEPIADPKSFPLCKGRTSARPPLPQSFGGGNRNEKTHFLQGLVGIFCICWAYLCVETLIGSAWRRRARRW